MGGFCGDPLWDTNVTWNTLHPQFTSCFRETVISSVPCAFLLVGCLVELSQLRKLPANRVPWNFFNVTKILFSGVLCLLSIFEFSDAFIDRLYGQDVNVIDYLSPLVRAIGFCMSTLLLLSYRMKGVHTSGVLFIFWAMVSVYATVDYLPAFRNYILNLFDKSYVLTESGYVLKTIFFPLVVSELLMACFADVTAENKFPDEDMTKVCPAEYSSFLSRLTFFWVSPLVRLGYKRPLKQDDMWHLLAPYRTDQVLERFQRFWLPAEKRSQQLLEQRANEPDERTLMLEESQTKPSKSQKPTINLLGPLLRAYWPQMLYLGMLKLVSSLLIFVGPTVLEYLIAFISNDEPAWRGYFYAFLLFFSAFIDSMISNQFEFGNACLALKVKASLIATIYRKALRLSSSGRSKFTTGEIVNFMSVDAMYIHSYVATYNLLWSAPLQIGICLYLIWGQLGVAAVGGYTVIVLMMPLNGFITMQIKRFQTLLMKRKADRLKLMNQLLNGIRVLKLYSWEESFNGRLMAIRADEIQYLKMGGYYLAGITFAFSCTPFFIALFSFALFIVVDPSNLLTPSKAFVSLSLFNMLTPPLAILPMAITFLVLFIVSLRRLNRFLEADELELDQIERAEDTEHALRVEDASFAWTRNAEPALKNLNLRIPHGKLVAVVGKVGAGKSSLFSALLGEMHKTSGRVNMAGRVSYVPQEAWIRNATLRDNVLLGTEFDEARYWNTLRITAMEPDLHILDAGDMTEIGEKGINLSGGQRQRVSLARACYNEADVYLLDDPLSAVDSNVGRHLFDQVIGPNGYLKQKTRILVTHKVTLLPFVDEIIVMKDSQITEQGSYTELLERNGEFAEILTQFVTEAGDQPDVDPEELDILDTIKKQINLDLSSSGAKKPDGESVAMGASNEEKVASIEKSAGGRSLSVEKRGSTGKRLSEPSVRKPTAGHLTSEETQAVGAVKWKVYVQYLSAVSSRLFIITLGGFFAFSSCNVAKSLWLSSWSNDAMDPVLANDTSLRNERLGVYAGIGLSETTLILVTAFSLNLAFVKASRVLHSSMLERLIRAPMQFFDTTPMGRVLNRFSDDLNVADVTLRMNFRMILVLGFRSFTSFLIMGFSTPLFYAVLAPLAIAYTFFQKFYLATSRQLKRIESTSRSPIFSHFSETVSGCTSIRAYGMFDRFMQECHRRIDVHNRCCYPGLSATRWMGVVLEFVGYSTVLAAALFTVSYRDTLSPGLAGLSITFALSITGTLSMLVRSFVDVETNIVAVERCIEFTKVPVETDSPDAQDVPQDWPDRGEIQISNYSARYRKELNPILVDLSLHIRPGEKIGIVGRTGSGKTSLTLALFRMLEQVAGSIVIDGLDLRRLRVHQLRKRLTIIPQEPFVFSGPVRKNLDPFDEHTDAEVWRALEQAHLKEHVQTLPGELSFELSEGGENLSVGQRQLICLGRALLRKTKILVLDEATAAIDFETDELIQRTIRTEFADCTIITIAHRINTIIDYDKIIVLRDGKVAEFAGPEQLIADPQSMFSQMVNDSK